MGHVLISMPPKLIDTDRVLMMYMFFPRFLVHKKWRICHTINYAQRFYGETDLTMTIIADLIFLNMTLFNYFSNCRRILDCFVWWLIRTSGCRFTRKRSSIYTRAKNVTRCPLTSSQLLIRHIGACCKVLSIFPVSFDSHFTLNSLLAHRRSLFDCCEMYTRPRPYTVKRWLFFRASSAFSSASSPFTVSTTRLIMLSFLIVVMIWCARLC